MTTRTIKYYGALIMALSAFVAALIVGDYWGLLALILATQWVQISQRYE